MSTLPSFVFSAFPSMNDGRLVGWAAYRDALAAGRAIGMPSGEPVMEPTGYADFPRVGIWRLLAPNNRELARSWNAYTSFESARAHVERLRCEVGALTVSGVRGDSPSQYGWVAASDGAAVITSGRWFGASSTALHSAATSLAAFATAVVPARVAPNRAQGRRRVGPSDAEPRW